MEPRTVMLDTPGHIGNQLPSERRVRDIKLGDDLSEDQQYAEGLEGLEPQCIYRYARRDRCD